MWEHEKDILEKVVPSALAAAVSLNEWFGYSGMELDSLLSEKQANSACWSMEIYSKLSKLSLFMSPPSPL